MKTVTISLNHGPSVTGWLLQIADHETFKTWMMNDAHRFAAFFAVLNDRVEWPVSLADAWARKSFQKGKTDGTSIRSEMPYEEWRKAPDHPFSGRLSAKFMEGFWRGLCVYQMAQRLPKTWSKCLKEVRRAFRQASQEAPLKNDDALVRLTRSLVVSGDDHEGGLLSRDVKVPNVQSTTFFHLHLMLLNVVLPFSENEKKVLEMAYVLNVDEAFRLFFELLMENARLVKEAIAVMLSVDVEDVEKLVDADSSLMLSRMVEFNEKSGLLPMSNFWRDWFQDPVDTVGELFGKLIVPMKKMPNSGALGRLAPEDRTLVQDILLAPSPHVRGVNVLMYGAKSIDKQGLVIDVLKDLHLDGYTLSMKVPDEDLPSACYVAQRLLAYQPDKVLIVQCADGVLTRTQRGVRHLMFFSLDVEDESDDSVAEKNLLLENPVRSVWLVHSAERLSEDNLGRFLYACEIKAASRAERRNEVETTLVGMNLSQEFITELSQHTRLGEQQLKSAARLADHVWQKASPQDQNDPAFREKIVRRAIEQSQKVLNRREREDLRQPLTQYSLNLLNTDGAFSVQQIIKALKNRPSASLCFWGLPGTGKTQLAEHIAVEIDKPILVKRASSILDKYLGESEKKIRLMFMEAADEDAVLLLDEADTFLRDRSLARYNHEVSMVNELLQAMERFRGLFICTTNLFQNMDAASLRRFTFKVRFLPLNPSQKWAMFCNEAGLSQAQIHSDDANRWQEELLFMTDLTPGDFATVKSQCTLLGLTLKPDEWIKQLRMEMNAKMKALRSSSVENASLN